MNSKERVKAVIDKREFDRIPIYGWLRANMKDKISDEFGSVEAFEDKYEFDYAHIFGGPETFAKDALDAAKKQKGELIPDDILQMLMCDANDSVKWESLRKSIEFYGKDRQRFTYIQTPGIFEQANRYFGIENHLMYLLLYPEDIIKLYRKQAEWNKQFAMNALDLGADMIHVSDDWGGQNSLLFSPRIWKESIAPSHKLVVDAVHARSAYASLHSDGNINDVLDGITDLGYDVLHPYQVSAGMSYETYFKKYSGSFTIMGGMDIQATLGFNRLWDVKQEIDGVIGMFKKRGFFFARPILCRIIAR
jgi:uroporphyrinogen decarboxylase